VRTDLHAAIGSAELGLLRRYGVDIRIVDTSGHELPNDGRTTGNLQVRGPYTIERYESRVKRRERRRRGGGGGRKKQGHDDSGSVAVATGSRPRLR
jgi:hypothetical protein